MSSRMKLDEIRRARGYSQEYMANKLGCHRNTYARMEEKPQNITMEEADKLATILNVSVNDIIFFRIKSTKCRLERESHMNGFICKRW